MTPRNAGKSHNKVRNTKHTVIAASLYSSLLRACRSSFLIYAVEPKYPSQNRQAHFLNLKRRAVLGHRTPRGALERASPPIIDNLIGTAARVVASQGWQGLLCNQRPLNWEIGHSHLCENDLPVPLTSEYAGGGINRLTCSL